ncbi:MAG: MATE family efflux transporter [Treponema sp.]|nr:MATE family efflux transporter [Treponema sp.]
MLKSFFHPDLLNGKIFRSLVFFTLPLLVSYIFQQLYNAADTVIIGHFLGENSLAAVGACTALYDLFVWFGVGFGNGLSITAARAFGSGDTEKLKKVTAASLVITLGITVLIMVLAHFFLYFVLESLGTPAEIIDESFSYISMIALWCGVLFLFNLFSGMLRAIGNSFVPLLFLILASLINVFLDILFMTKFQMGIYGAALATVIAQGISGLLTLFYILRRARILVPSLESFKFDRKLYSDLLGQGLSMAFMSSLVQSGTVILQKAINGFGSYIIAGHNCARKIFSLTNLPLITLGVSFSTFVSQNFGAGKTERIKKGVFCGFLISAVWSCAMLVFIPISIKPLAAFISGSSNPEILDYTFRYMLFAVCFYFPLGAIFVIRNSLQGLGCKILPLFSSVIELVGKIIFVALIIPRAGIWGIIACEPLIWCAMCVHLFYALFTNRIMRKENAKQ